MAEVQLEELTAAENDDDFATAWRDLFASAGPLDMALHRTRHGGVPGDLIKEQVLTAVRREVSCT